MYIYTGCLFYHADIESSTSSVHKEGVSPALHTTQDASEVEHQDQPAETDEKTEPDDHKEMKQKPNHNMDQSQEHDNDNKEANAVQLQHQQEVVLEQEVTPEEDNSPRDSTEPEATEKVETFFSTMSHRYEHVTQESHIS